ncbi:MAG: ion transporter [Hyphomicrobium sp. 32-62-53]|nr:MAG: ion transporter [Hyphomicrobium sp. 12-62-95]OYX99691.1 MAG: ion transporter [Hyphomicrobium sp. 32-62-53]
MADATAAANGENRTERLRAILESQRFQLFIIAVIIINAATIGLETSKTAMAAAGGLIYALDMVALAIFIVEIAAKLFVYRLTFFRNPWNVFDFTIVAVSLVPAGEGLSVLRALRILRALRLISMVPQMRLVVQALLSAIPAMNSVIALLALIFYVAAVIATKLYGVDFPEWFGTIGASLYTLFQIMTLESWSMGIVRPVMEVHPYAWAFFVPFILIITFAVLNLFIAIVVNSMTNAAAATATETTEPVSGAQVEPVTAAGHHLEGKELASLLEEVRLLRRELSALQNGRIELGNTN